MLISGVITEGWLRCSKMANIDHVSKGTIVVLGCVVNRRRKKNRRKDGVCGHAPELAGLGGGLGVFSNFSKGAVNMLGAEHLILQEVKYEQSVESSWVWEVESKKLWW